MGRANLPWNEAKSGGFVIGQSRGHGSTEKQFRTVRRRLHGHGRLFCMVDRDQQSSGHELLH